MQLIHDNQLYNIEDKYIEYSPYLTTLCSTQVGVEKQGEAYILDDPIFEHIEQYLNFLQGKEFELDEDLFDYMGHHNIYEYPSDFWEVKLYDTWVRDNFYRLELHKDPYYGLVEIPVIEERVRAIVGCLEELPKHHYIAGGAALYMAGITSKAEDIDVFTTNIKASEEWLKFMQNGADIRYTSNTINIVNGRKMVQLILRCYTCPSEIVHGFDVGCCGVIYDGKHMYATKRALYSIKNNCNWLEPDRSSPSYIYRLCKYNTRPLTTTDVEKVGAKGFDIMFPLNSYFYIDYQAQKEVQEKLRKLVMDNSIVYNCIYYYHTKVKGKCIIEMMISDGLSEHLVRLACDIEQSTFSVDKWRDILCNKYGCREDYISNILFKIVVAESDNPLVDILLNAGGCRYFKQWYPEYWKLIPTDYASLLVWQCMFNVGYNLLTEKVSDYSKPITENPLTDVEQLTWKTCNPMEQLTGSFNPQSIEDLDAFYLTSPFFKAL